MHLLDLEFVVDRAHSVIAKGTRRADEALNKLGAVARARMNELRPTLTPHLPVVRPLRLEIDATSLTALVRIRCLVEVVAILRLLPLRMHQKDIGFWVLPGTPLDPRKVIRKCVFHTLALDAT